MIPPEYIKLFKPVAEKHNKSLQEIWEMYISQFEFIANTIRNADMEDESTFKSFRLFRIGVILYNPLKYKKVREKIKTKENECIK